MSAMAAAAQNPPMLVLGGRAPALRWGMGSLQEIDHIPFVAPLTGMRPPRNRPRRWAIGSTTRCRAAVGPPSGPAFCRLPDGSRVRRAVDRGQPGALTEPARQPGADADQLDWPWLCCRRRNDRSSWLEPTCGGLTPRQSCCTWPRSSEFRCWPTEWRAESSAPTGICSFSGARSAALSQSRRGLGGRCPDGLPSRLRRSLRSADAPDRGRSVHTGP